MRSESELRRPLRVGIVGCGSVTQSIHLPVLARLPDLWEVVHVADLDLEGAQWVAQRTGARASTDPMAVIDDPDVEVVVVCSPHSYHAEHVVAACRAGKLAVLCEKPMSTTLAEAELIAAVSRETSVPVVTATMHLFDPAFAEALAQWPTDTTPDLIESTCFLPPNSTFIDQATQVVMAQGVVPKAGAAPQAAAASRAEQLVGGILGLASHHLPLVRRFASGGLRLVSADTASPWGYNILMASETSVVRMLAVAPAPALTWEFHAHSETACLRASFPPSFVQAGSARVQLSVRGEATRVWESPESGYLAEWRLLYSVARAETYSPHWVEAGLADMALAQLMIDGVEGAHS